VPGTGRLHRERLGEKYISKVETSLCSLPRSAEKASIQWRAGDKERPKKDRASQVFPSHRHKKEKATGEITIFSNPFLRIMGKGRAKGKGRWAEGMHPIDKKEWRKLADTGSREALEPYYYEGEKYQVRGGPEERVTRLKRPYIYPNRRMRVFKGGRCGGKVSI